MKNNNKELIDIGLKYYHGVEILSNGFIVHSKYGDPSIVICPYEVELLSVEEKIRRLKIYLDMSLPIEYRLDTCPGWITSHESMEAIDIYLEEAMEEPPIFEELEEILGIMYNTNLTMEENVDIFYELQSLGLVDYKAPMNIFKPLPKGKELRIIIGEKYNEHLSEKENIVNYIALNKIINQREI